MKRLIYLILAGNLRAFNYEIHYHVVWQHNEPSAGGVGTSVVKLSAWNTDYTYKYTYINPYL